MSANIKKLYATTFVNKQFIHAMLLRAVLCLLFAASPAIISANEITEHQIKAAYLYQLTQFVEWPEAAFDVQQPTFRLCVLGNDAIARQLTPLSKRTHNGRPIIVAFPQSISTVHGCHLLYIGASDSHHEAAILKKFKDAPMLTVSSQPGFAARGGIIGFVIVDKRVRLVINRIVARHVGIELSAKLLEVAVAYNDEPFKEELP